MLLPLRLRRLSIIRVAGHLRPIYHGFRHNREHPALPPARIGLRRNRGERGVPAQPVQIRCLFVGDVAVVVFYHEGAKGSHGEALFAGEKREGQGQDN